MSGGDERRALQAAVAGRYAIERELGRGGMGVVFLARDLALERTVAIKLLPQSVAQEPSMRQGFLREARTAAGLSHPNIVSIHLVEERDGLVYFVMTHIDGETLAQRVRRAGPLTVAAALQVIQEVAWALAYAHGRGVVHRDVKPENIMLERGSGRAMVTDFGIALRRDGRPRAAGEIVGTAQFMSPEQAQGQPVDPRSDLYSLGVTAFFALTGALPFDAHSPVGVMAQQIARAAPRIRDVRPEVPELLAAAVDRCLAKSRAERFPTGESLAEVIAAIRSSTPVVPPVIRRLQRAVLLVWALGPAMLVAFTWLVLMAPAVLSYGIALLLGAWSLTMLDLLSHLRLAQRAGFGREDLVAAFAADALQRRDEEAAGGWVVATLARPAVLIAAAGLGIIAMMLSMELPELGVQSPHWRVKLAFIGTALIALVTPIMLAAAAQARQSARVWSGAIGRFYFAMAGLGLRRRGSGR